MEEFWLGVAEKSILGAGFFYLLYYLIKNLELITISLQSVSDTLIKIDIRMIALEEKVKELEKH